MFPRFSGCCKFNPKLTTYSVSHTVVKSVITMSNPLNGNDIPSVVEVDILSENHEGMSQKPFLYAFSAPDTYWYRFPSEQPFGSC